MALARTYDTVICGGAAVGSSIAYFLARQRQHPRPSILVIEKDSSYKHSATALCAASFRTQFSTPENIQMSLFGGHFFKHINEYLGVEGGQKIQLQLREQGYLFLGATANTLGLQHMRENHETQRREGARVQLLDRAALKAKYPWMSVDDVEMASLGLEGEGWLDAYSLLQAFKAKAQSLGVDYVTDSVVGLDLNESGSAVQVARLASGAKVELKHFVNASGTSADAVARMAGFTLPVRARRRCIFVFRCATPLPSDFPMLIDTTGVYVRPEGPQGQYLTGISPPHEQDPDVAEGDFDVTHALFDDIIWPALAARVPAFESLKLTSHWAGHYAFNTFDHNLIAGRHPSVRNMLLANGCSGHGLMHSPAVGRALAELIEHGAYRSIDLSRFAFTRLLSNTPIVEKNVI